MKNPHTISATMLRSQNQFVGSFEKRFKTAIRVIITSGRNKVPVAKLEAIKPKVYKRLGARYDPNFVLGEAFWEPLPEGWDGESEPPK